MRAFSIKETGPGPIISALYQQVGLRVRETINNTLIWDEKQCQLDPGTHVLALIINKQLLANLPDHFTAEELEKIIYG